GVHRADASEDGGANGMDLGAAGDASAPTTTTDGGGTDFSGSGTDGGSGSDGGSGTDGSSAGIITGGPCASGANGATAYRVRWAGTGAGSTAYPVYEVNGLPDKTRDHTGAYTYQIGSAAEWDDPYLGAGGLVLDGGDFVDIEISMGGIAHVTSATLAILGRSFATTSDGSFSWQTASGTGATAIDAVSNVAPYAWYGADVTAVIDAGDTGLLLRMKAGPSSDSLVVNRIELCLVAN
ncbi:MAG: hypothetical protein ABI321_13485, partial [Polyangia bacterium]